MEVVFIINILTTFYMLGIIWFVQIVHYPLFSFASKESFPEFAKEHSRLSTYVVILPMIVELISSFVLIFLVKSFELKVCFFIGLLLVLIIWFSTFFLQVPQHKKLGNGYDQKANKYLVNSNWLRTVCWTLRSIICIYLFKVVFL